MIVLYPLKFITSFFNLAKNVIVKLINLLRNEYETLGLPYQWQGFFKAILFSVS